MSTAVASAFLAISTANAAEQLLPQPEPSPTGQYAANVEWESLGQVGVLRMVIYGKDKRVRGSVEVPQVRPDPADLTWLNDKWVMCESFLGERASGFFYVDAKELKGYLLEIFAVRASGTWEFDVTYADRQTSMTVSPVSSGRCCLFPVVLGPLPETEDEYFTLAFCERFVGAVQAYREWRRKQNIETLDFVGEVALRPGTGGLIACLVNKEPSVIWFPLSSLSSEQVLKLSRIHRIDPALRSEFLANRELIRTEWLIEEKPQKWRFAVKRISSREGKGERDDATLHEGMLEDVLDLQPALVLTGNLSTAPEEASSSGPLRVELEKRAHKARTGSTEKKRSSGSSQRNKQLKR